MKETEDMKKLKTMGFKIIEAPEWLLDKKIGGMNKNILPEMAAFKIEKETEKAYFGTGTRIPTEELTDEQKVVLLKMYLQKNIWMPKSQIKMVG